MTDIQNNNQLLKFVCEDLRSVQSLILTVTDHPEYANANEMLGVMDKALKSITDDIQGAIYNIDKSLMKE